MQPSLLWIHGLGVTSPLGDTAATTAAAVRAGVSRRRESAFINGNGDPMITAEVPESALPPLAPALAARADLPPRHRRMLRLATHALREATKDLAATDRVPLLLATPEPHPGLPAPAFTDTLLADLALQTGAPLWLERSALAPPGRPGALVALTAAAALLRDPAVDCVLVGGVDTYLDAGLLAQLDRERRVTAVGVRDGFAPGEGAAFVLLSGARERAGVRARVTLSLPGLGHEPGHRHSDVPHRGDGLADAVREALRGRPPASVPTVHAGLNGEHDGARAWAVAALRSSEALAAGLRVEHPADCLGDAGAAMAPTAVALAAIALEQRTLSAPILLWCAADGPLRAATILDDHPDDRSP